ncbi:hypothetical protein [Halogranum rubrum]|uniref:Uncharacterized protein n=1 Tax=Halogranum salarium B-1 TaxID=1210908 RepID=J3ETX1_9EURY|nr:hypothetical protein [Halogranum salarium]EJN57667.1 hypothetical protein HSB1_40280 [Halogranum salarium B-1]
MSTIAIHALLLSAREVADRLVAQVFDVIQRPGSADRCAVCVVDGFEEPWTEATVKDALLVRVSRYTDCV